MPLLPSTRRLAGTAALALSVFASTAATAAPIEARFTFAFTGGESVEVAGDETLEVAVVFDDAHALIGAGDTSLLFPSDADGASGAALASSFTFSSALLSRSDLTGDLFQSIFFDIASTSGSVFEVGSSLSGVTSFELSTIDASGCFVGLSSIGLGLGASTSGGCRTAFYDATAPLAISFTRAAANVPEPSAWSLLALGALAALSRRAVRASRI
jgi:hypothetical protein